MTRENGAATPKIAPYKDSIEQMLGGIRYIDLRIRWAVARAGLNGLNPDDQYRGLYVSRDEVKKLMSYDFGRNLWTELPDEIADEMRVELSVWPQLIKHAHYQWGLQTKSTRQAGIEMRFDQLVRDFELSGFEIDALLIAIAPEIDTRYERMYAYLEDDVTRKRPTVNLILNLMTNDFQEKLRMRQRFIDSATLIRHKLLVRYSTNPDQEPAILTHFLKPPARLVDHLLGHEGVDEQLVDFASLRPVLKDAGRRFESLPIEHRIKLERSIASNPLFAFIGGYGVGKQKSAEFIAHCAQCPLITLDLVALNKHSIGLHNGLDIAIRDARLTNAVLYLKGWDTVVVDSTVPPGLLNRLLAHPGIIVTAGEIYWQPKQRDQERLVFSVPFGGTEFGARLQVWEDLIPNSPIDLTQVANQFRFTPGQIEDAAASARDFAQWRDAPLADEDILVASRVHSNQKLSTLATKIMPRYRWKDIVLPRDTLSQLREAVNTVKQRPTVYDKWGFGRKMAMGKGLNALFAGEPGTGKTMSAEIIANELGLDMYKIDLSMVVSKYIGETEKNISKIFDEAATSNAILFFDEADSIFGKRSEVKDSHDRHANIEVSYLLQRMETFDGVVILATNLRSNIDEAFTRRLHFAIQFPFPKPVDRERIWRVTFPKETPLADDVDFRVLAQRFRLAGGSIRNIVLASAFLAAESGANKVSMEHLLHATRREHQKIGRLLNEQLFGNREPERMMTAAEQQAQRFATRQRVKQKE
ncbi:MAG: ATP-binding protein [Candidatus Promineifilaceae bacterium]